jgi:hypothetical protein
MRIIEIGLKTKEKNTHAHTINRLVIISCLYTKLREKEKKKNEVEYSNCNRDNYNNNTCSCL